MTTRVRNRAGRAAIGRLFQAATDVFGSVGYNAATVDDIVARSGMARTTFYEYFGGKDDLFRAVLTEVGDDIHAHALSLQPIRDDAASQASLRVWVDGFVTLYARHAALLCAWTEAEAGAGEFGAFGPKLFGSTTKAIAAAIRAGDPTDVDPGASAVAFLSVIERLNYYAAAGLLGVDADAITDTLTAVIHDSLFGASRRR
ncbi:MAG TPA: TetR/AcrR family transcriptional regulator [Acidimicrobiales bacterium]|nr:TetR/AcrR family transcriptional regulator [Acidimicrobiales bacterium]